LRMIHNIFLAMPTSDRNIFVKLHWSAATAHLHHRSGRDRVYRADCTWQI